MRRLPSFFAAIALAACRTPPKDDVSLGLGVDTGGLDGDADGDGRVGSDDCDELDPAVYDGAEEICDGIDNDCDGIVDEGVTEDWFGDADGDGFGDATDVRQLCEPT